MSQKPILEEKVSLHNYDDLDKLAKWWLTDEEAIYRHVFAISSMIERQQSLRRFQLIKWQRLYSNYEVMGFASTMFSRTTTENNLNNRISLNVIKSCVDTATAKIAKTKPRPLFLTEKGDHNLQQKAKKLTQYLDGIFYAANVYEVAQLVFRDACIFGTGAMLVHVVDDEIQVERVMINELIVDETDAVYAQPTCMYRKKWVSRDKLIDMFPEHRERIDSAKAAVQGEMQSANTADQVVVVEAWHLPSSKNANDGRHTLTIQNCTLMAESYDKDYFPIITIAWSPRVFGFFGTGIALDLEGIQLEITKILRNIQLAQHLACVPRMWVDSASGVAISKINNEPGAIYKFSGQKPIIDTGAGMAPEVYSHLQWLIQQAYQIVGISQLSAQSQKPAGLNSGIALRTYQDVETERFAIVGQAWEKFFINTAKVMINMSKDLYMSGKKDLAVKVPGKKFIETIKWKDVNLKEDQYSMKAFPVSILPTTPEAKLQMIQEMVQSGFISQQEAIALFDFPDLDEWNSLNTAPLDAALMLIGNILDEGKYRDPEPFMDLNLTLKLANYSLLRAECNGVEEDRLDMLRTFIGKVTKLQQAAQPPAPPPQQGSPAGQAPPPPQAPMAPQGSGPVGMPQ